MSEFVKFVVNSQALLSFIVALMLAACGGGGSATESAPLIDSASSTVTVPQLTPPTTEAASTSSAPTTSPADITTSTIGGPPMVTIDVEGGIVTGPSTIKVSLGDRVVLIVTADIEDEVHLHGYDVVAKVSADAGATVEFEATIPGIFELELEGAGLLLAEIEVR